MLTRWPLTIKVRITRSLQRRTELSMLVFNSFGLNSLCSKVLKIVGFGEPVYFCFAVFKRSFILLDFGNTWLEFLCLSLYYRVYSLRTKPIKRVEPKC
jgi:hypothetical protein